MTAALDPHSIIIAAAFAVGFALLFIGLRGRRIGAEPRCRKCGYDLTGAASENCSECGAAINQQGIVHGTRRRRPVMIALSLLIVAAAGTFGAVDGYRQLQSIDKYRHYPFSWLIDGGHAGDLAALKELDRRLRADELSNKQTQTLITDALAEQAIVPSTAPAATQAWVNMLELLCQANKLSGAQQRQYFEQFYTYELVVRPQVRAGEPVPFAIRKTSSGPSWQVEPMGKGRPISAQMRNIRFTRLDDPNSIPIHPVHHNFIPGTHIGGHYVRGPYNDNRSSFYLTLTPGVYEMALDLDEEIFDYHDFVTHSRNGMLNQDFGASVCSRTLHFASTFEVVPADTPDSIKLIHDPSLADPIRAALAFEPQFPTLPGSEPFVSILIQSATRWPTATLPVNVAFDLYVRIADREWKIGGFSMSAGPVGSNGAIRSVPVKNVTSVDIILRSSPDVARNTVDMYEIWDGELVFKDVPVKQEGK